MAEPAHEPHKEYEPDIRPNIRPNLRALEGGGESTEPKQGHLSAVPDNERRESSRLNPTSDDRKASGSNEAQGAETGRSLYNAEGDRQGRLQRMKGKARGLKGNKWLFGGILGGTSLITLIVVALIIIAGAYKVVDFAEHVAVYQFARVTRQMSDSADIITAEKIGIDAADDSALGRLKARYGAATGKVSDTWSKLDKYRPQKSIDNLKGRDKLTFNYEDRKLLPGQTLKSVTINGKEVGIIRGSPKNLIPGYKFAKDISFARDFAPAFNDALETNGVGTIVRGAAARQIRKELGVSLVAWTIGKYTGKTDAEADTQLQEDVFKAAEGDGKVPKLGTNTDTVAEEAHKAEEQCMQDNACAASTVKNQNAAVEAAQKVIDNGIKETGLASVQSGITGVLSKITSFINPVFAIATPVCLIYDGSIVQSGPTMDAQSAHTERNGLWVQSAAAQEKDGYNVAGEAVGATDRKIADISKSNAEKRASGLPVDTSNYMSTEASPTGQYTHTVADFLPGPLGGVADSIGSMCPALTNLWVGLGVGVANIALQTLLDVPTGGAASGVDAGVTAAAEAAANATVPALTRSLVSNLLDAGSSVFSKKTVTQIGLIGGATVLAKILVLSQISATHNSLAYGKPYDDQSEAGTNIYAGQIEQRHFYGAPLSDSELNQDDASNRRMLAIKTGRESVFTRYMAVNNPDSLVSKTAIMTSGYVNRSVFGSLLRVGSGIFSPVQSLGALFSPLVGHSVSAAGAITSKNTYYGNVQFGYTAEEEGLMHDKNLTYGDVLENQTALDVSGKEDEINAKYGKCFDGTESIGTMLANGDIKRDQSGDVLQDDSLCSPKSLGPHNPQYGDLVFRWRLAHNYNNTLDHLTCEQDTQSACDQQSGGGSSTASSSTSGAVSGDAQQLAQQILQQAKAGKIQFNVLNSSDTADGSAPEKNIEEVASGKPAKTTSNCSGRGVQAPNADTPLNSDLLKFILQLSQQSNIQVNALAGECHHESSSNHYKGVAVDFGCPFDSALADSIGKQYNISDQTGETCANSGHFHYSVGGH